MSSPSHHTVHDNAQSIDIAFVKPLIKENQRLRLALQALDRAQSLKAGAAAGFKFRASRVFDFPSTWE